MINITKELFQWEKGREAIVSDSQISFVYFYNKKSNNSKREEVVNGRVSIPDALLKEDLPITALCCDSSKQALGRKTFKVLSTKRPEDYIDTEDYLEVIYDGGVEL